MVLFMVSMWIAGLIQGQNWGTYTVPFLQTVISLKPYFGARLIGGALAGIGILLFAYNMWRTGRREVTA